MTTWAIIPVKPLRQSKRRLAHLLSADERADLIHSFLDELLAVLNETPGIAHVLLVSGDRTVIALADKYGAAVLVETEPAGLNVAVARGVDYAVHHGAFVKGEARVMMGEVNALFVVAGTDEEVATGNFIQEKAHIF